MSWIGVAATKTIGAEEFALQKATASDVAVTEMGDEILNPGRRLDWLPFAHRRPLDFAASTASHRKMRLPASTISNA